MILYAKITYALVCVALLFTCFSFMRVLWGMNMQFFTKGFFGILIFALALFPINNTSLAMIFYNIFDMPSFLLLLICILSILRSFSEQINCTISYLGFLYLCFFYVMLVCNAFNLFDWAYGLPSYKFLIVAILSAFAYSFDRNCGFLMLTALIMWLPFSNIFSVYNAIFDPVVMLFFFMIQSIPVHKNNFHVTLFRPKTR